MPQDNKRLLAELALSSQERGDLELKLIQSESELAVVHGEFTEATRLHIANLAQIQALLEDSDKILAERTAELAESEGELNALRHERECFAAALHDLKNPLTGSTQILEYIAAGKVAPESQAEILKQIIDSNKHMLSGAERLATAAKSLSHMTTRLRHSSKALVERTEQLGKSNADLKAMMQQREDFVAALTHDLKNPLIGATRILELIVAEPGAVHNETLALVIESNKGMLRMIRNLLDVYRHESGRLMPVNESVELAVILKKCLEEFSFNIKQKRLELVLDYSDDLPSVQTDSILLQRVLLNLLDNAVKFTPDGGKLILSAVFDDALLKISVKDTGPGMSDERVGRIFQRVCQTGQARKYTGSGLGLFLSSQIMAALGGRLECESTENVGTTLTIILPCQSQSPVPEQKGASGS